MADKSDRLKKVCLKCNKSQTVDKYYKSESDEYADKLYPVCKNCVVTSVNTENIGEVQDQLMKLNRPFVYNLWESSKEEAVRRKMTIFGVYMKNVQLAHNRHLTWKDSIFEDDMDIENYQDDENKKYKFDFEITPEIILRWGSNYEAEDFIKLEDFYQKMKTSNKIETPSDETYLKKLSVISLKMDKELEAGRYGQVKQLGDLFSKYMADSKFRASDKTEADKTGGIRNFSTIYAEVEKDGHIPPWEHYRKIKGIDQDMVDKTIMHIENFTLRLNKIDRMSEPPSDTPKIHSEDVME
ncbi:hypothetical protein MHB54_01010 [Paenibacillus sp. FSL M7-0802]|uniref:hypothetical protein n=1 Tax=Paenibacillus sp. FSL M7-0802 TaxID=2921536 RepID=UPI0030F96B2A